MSDEKIVPIRPVQPTEVRKPRKRRMKLPPSISDMEKAVNGLHLVKDWAIGQSNSDNSTDDLSVCAVMELIYSACDVINRAIEAAPCQRENLNTAT